MLRNRRAMGLSITTIIVAIIGLLILVVLIGILTGRINIYQSGVKELTTCENTCKNIGYDNAVVSFTEAVCNSDLFAPSQVIPGKYSDVSSGNVCCCLRNR